MRILAIIPTYNEADILPAVLTHLHAQGVDTYVIDNWSTDGFVGGEPCDLAYRLAHNYMPVTAQHQKECTGLVHVEKFPSKPVHIYQWERILRRVEEVALEYSNQYDWMMLHDADEIRRAPVNLQWHQNSPGDLVQAMEWVDGQGYNVIDFQVYTFPPIDNGFIPGNNPEKYFTKYRRESGYEKVSQEKCWKAIPGVRVNLSSSGGHRAVHCVAVPAAIPERRVCPHKFILKHYPIRSQAHGERKVFEERRKRWHLGERNKNWHTQYDGVKEGDSFLADPQDLIEY